jgi:hypothetical protein
MNPLVLSKLSALSFNTFCALCVFSASFAFKSSALDREGREEGAKDAKGFS